MHKVYINLLAVIVNFVLTSHIEENCLRDMFARGLHEICVKCLHRVYMNLGTRTYVSFNCVLITHASAMQAQLRVKFLSVVGFGKVKFSRMKQNARKKKKKKTFQS